MPFCNTWERDTHFVKHGHKFGAADAEEYERMADTFVLGATAGDARDCIRPNDGDRVRFGFVTHLEGIVRRRPEPECVRSFYPVRETIIARHGGEAGYFSYECARAFGVNL
jgi:hypothetical protein